MFDNNNYSVKNFQKINKIQTVGDNIYASTDFLKETENLKQKTQERYNMSRINGSGIIPNIKLDNDTENSEFVQENFESNDSNNESSDNNSYVTNMLNVTRDGLDTKKAKHNKIQKSAATYLNQFDD